MFWTELWLSENMVRNSYDIHKTLWKMFPGQSKREFLYTVTERQRGQGARVLLQSQESPCLAECGPSITVLRQPKSLAGIVLQPGQILRFRLVANPTKKIRDAAQQERAIRVPHVGQHHQIAWLTRKLDGIGRVVYAEAQETEPIHFSKSGQRGKVQPVCFTGVLEVLDGDAFRDMLNRGIGPAKSFGCGLMQLAPP